MWVLWLEPERDHSNSGSETYNMWSFTLQLLYVFVVRYLGQGISIKIRNKSGDL